jgi:CRAL/TRIO domain
MITKRFKITTDSKSKQPLDCQLFVIEATKALLQYRVMCNQSPASAPAAEPATGASSESSSSLSPQKKNRQRRTATCSTSSDVSSTSSSRHSQILQEEKEWTRNLPVRRKQGRVKYFLLGFLFAIVLLSGAVVSTLYGMCKDRLKSSSSSAVCPSTLDLKKRKRKRGLLSLFRRNKEEQMQADCILSPRDPAACVCHWIQNSLQNLLNTAFIHPREERESQNTTAVSASNIHLPRPKEDFPTAFTPEAIQLSNRQERLIKELEQRIRTEVPDWDERVTRIPWGGIRNGAETSTTTQWWAPALPSTSKATPLETFDGGNLLFSYLRIMNWPQDMDVVHFPFKTCNKQGCPATFALNHTLNFREIYQPWLVTPSMKTVNSRGLIYHHGFSPSLDGEQAPHGIVFLRPGLVVQVDEAFYARTLVRELERTVTLSMEQSKGRVGKFNVVVSGKDISFGAMPSLKGIKTFVTILQDHYVDRLGVVLLTDMGRICEILLKLFLPLITEEVRNKIVLVPHNDDEKQAVFETVLGSDNVPAWLGGESTYQFDVNDYYASDDVIEGTDSQATEYLTLMPYHA